MRAHDSSIVRFIVGLVIAAKTNRNRMGSQIGAPKQQQRRLQSKINSLLLLTNSLMELKIDLNMREEAKKLEIQLTKHY